MNRQQKRQQERQIKKELKKKTNELDRIGTTSLDKKKVEASIKKLGYQVNYYARGLKTQRTYTVAAIVPEILNPFFASWVYYIEQAL